MNVMGMRIRRSIRNGRNRVLLGVVGVVVKVVSQTVRERERERSVVEGRQRERERRRKRKGKGKGKRKRKRKRTGDAYQ